MAMSHIPVYHQPFAISECKARLDRIQKRMSEQDLHALLVTIPENIYYVSGYRSAGHGVAPIHVLIVPREGEPRILARVLERETVLRFSWTRDPVFYRDFEDPFVALRRVIGEMGLSEPKRIGLEMGSWYMPARTCEKLRATFATTEFRDCTGLIEEFRMVKSQQELEYMRKSAKLTEIGLTKGIEATEVGAHEYEVAAEILHAMYKNGQDDSMSTWFSVNSGPSGGCGHDSYRDKIIEKNDLVYIEVTGCHHLYMTNGIVAIYMGRAPSKLREIHEVTVRLHNECVRACKPGVTGEEVWSVADRINRAAGLGEYGRRIGVSLGLSAQPNYFVSEGYDLIKGEKRPLKAGMILSIEPGTGAFGIGTEKIPVGTVVGSDIIITENGNEQLVAPMVELIEK